MVCAQLTLSPAILGKCPGITGGKQVDVWKGKERAALDMEPSAANTGDSLASRGSVLLLYFKILKKFFSFLPRS